ncbi:MAG: helix-turn-helix domain-containing protein [Clostridia bacterium]|nr:helix-turn-helix domain-containing protein [Clostridia bacterium]
MSNSIMTKYKISGQLKTTISGKLIYTLLGELADENGEIQISNRSISNTLKISKGTVSKNLHRLERNGYLFVRAMYREDGGRIANKYILR